MAAIKEIEIEVKGARDLALIDKNDGVWLVVPLRWWDLSRLFFWMFVPFDLKATISLKMLNGQKVRFKAVRVATRHMRVTGVYT